MDYEVARLRMVREQIIKRGITDKRVLHAMSAIPRHYFIDQAFWPRAYSEHPLPIGHQQTISQPYIVALMTQELELPKGSKILEIGTGSGYQAAVLGVMGMNVVTIERTPELSKKARAIVDNLKINGIKFHIGDGSNGLKELAPYDGIIVTAGAPALPDILLDQLKVNGRIIIPVGSRDSQKLVKIVKGEKYVEKREICGCTFVPLVGDKGWDN